MYCSNCGIPLEAGMNFCPNCGARVSPVVTATEPGYRVMLVSVGASDRATAAALLSRICGYTDEEALLIVDSAPITVARGLSDAQARYLAQALAEYGIEVSVYDGKDWREWEPSSTSVWDQRGSLLSSVASALGLLGMGNRITRDMMYRADDSYRMTGSRPPVFRVNSALRTAPRPPVHRAPPPPARPAPPPARPAPQPARPAPQPARPAPQPVRPAPPPARPAPQSTRPAPPPARPEPLPARHAPQSGRPGDPPGRGNPGGRPGGGMGRRG